MVNNNRILVFHSFFPHLKNAHMLTKAHCFFFYFFKRATFKTELEPLSLKFVQKEKNAQFL